MAGNASCKKTRSPALVGSSLDLSLAIVIPATENTLSDGADVAGIASIFDAILERMGY